MSSVWPVCVELTVETDTMSVSEQAGGLLLKNLCVSRIHQVSRNTNVCSCGHEEFVSSGFTAVESCSPIMPCWCVFRVAVLLLAHF